MGVKNEDISNNRGVLYCCYNIEFNLFSYAEGRSFSSDKGCLYRPTQLPLNNLDLHKRGVHPFVVMWSLSRYGPETHEGQNRKFRRVASAVASAVAFAYRDAGREDWAKFFEKVAALKKDRMQFISYWNGLIKKVTHNKYYITKDGGCVYAPRKHLF